MIHPLLARYRPLVGDFEAFVEASRRPLPTCVWTHSDLAAADAVERGLRRAGLTPSPLPWLPGAYRVCGEGRPAASLPFLAGWCHVQEEVSLVPPHLLGARPGERILDLCAAPGGKALRIALDVGAAGTLVANDRSPDRIRALRGVLERVGVLNVAGTMHNGANLPLRFGGFDGVLCDVPCTGEGNSRKSPRVLEEIGERDRGRLPALQQALLYKAFLTCRPGGRIVYSTCTYAPEENEAVVDAVLRRAGAALRVAPASIPALRAAPGLTAWAGAVYHPDLRHALRFWPHLNDTGGFFVAVLEKALDAPLPPGAADAPAPPRPAEADACLAFLEERFGIPPSTFSALRLFQTRPRRLEMASDAVRPPPPELIEFLGARFCHLDGAAPLPTSVMARLFARHGSRNLVHLDERQVQRYLARQDVAVAGDNDGPLAPGWVLVCHDGVALGTGLLRRRVTGLELESYFPKAWAIAPR